MFSFFKKAFTKVYEAITSPLKKLFSRNQIDEDALRELKKILLSADTGVATTRHIITRLQENVCSNAIADGNDLKKHLGKILVELLEQQTYTPLEPGIVLFTGVNGTGKTTSIGKYADLYRKQGKRVLVAAADTFRAAAIEQVERVAQRANVDIIRSSPGQDPASVAYKACTQYKADGYDVLLIDTAGRVQTNINLMKELAKIKRSVAKVAGDEDLHTLLTIDAMLGQNSFDQARLFNEHMDIDGVLLTKMDGTAKGGIVFSLAHELNLPVAYLTHGEGIEEISRFDASSYVDNLLNA